MGISSLIWVITRKCIPGNCFYCNVLKEEVNCNLWEDLFYRDKLYLDFLLKKLNKFLKKSNICSIRFFGGEPLILKEVVYYIIKKIRFMGFGGDIIINTNLYLFDKLLFKKIKKFGVKIITSLNGKSHIHCMTRGISSKEYDNLVKNIKFLIDSGFDLQVNFVIFPFKYDIYGNLKYLFDLGIKKVNILPLFYSNLLRDVNIDDFILRVEKVLNILSRKEKEKVLNFKVVKFNKYNFLPLFQDELVLDYDGSFYYSMVILEKFFDGYKEILFLGSIKEIDFLDISFKIDKEIIYKIVKILNNKFGDIFFKSIYLSKRFSNLFKYNNR